MLVQIMLASQLLFVKLVRLSPNISIKNKKGDIKMSVQKHIRLPEKVDSIIKKVKEEYDFRSEAEAISFMILLYDKEELISTSVVEKIKSEFTNEAVRFRLGLRTAERNSIKILDVLNTMLFTMYEEEPVFIPADNITSHDIILASENRITKIISKNTVKKKHQEQSPGKKAKKG